MKTRTTALTVFSICVLQAAASSSADAQTPPDHLRTRFRKAPVERSPDKPTERPADSHLPIGKAHDVRPVAASPLQHGANCLFIGHSFFIPVANEFDKIASRSEFSSHQAKFVFAPGLGGSPSGIWENERRRQQAERVLAGGTIDLLGMTVAVRSKDPIADYRQWIVLARKYNPRTQFFIGQYWLPGGPRMDEQKYTKANEAAAQRNYETVAKLRREYPDAQIHFINYGKIAAEMKERFRAGTLPDIEQMVGGDDKSLFRDRFMGHGGVLIHDLSARLWLNTLYGADLETLTNTSHSAKANAILEQAVTHNKRFK